MQSVSQRPQEGPIVLVIRLDSSETTANLVSNSFRHGSIDPCTQFFRASWMDLTGYMAMVELYMFVPMQVYPNFIT